MQNDLTSMSDDQLLKSLKTTQTMTYVLAGALLVLLMASIYLTKTQGFNVLTVIPIAQLPILVMLSKKVKSIKEEAAKRNLNL